MTHPDFRALCSRLHELLEDIAKTHQGLDDSELSTLLHLREQTRAALSAEPQQGAPSDEAWQEFIEQLQQVQHVALGEGQGPRFDLVEFALAAWRYGAQAAPVAVDTDVIRALVKAEAALADIGDAEREPGDNLKWCERRAAEALPFVREVVAICTALPLPQSEAQP